MNQTDLDEHVTRCSKTRNHIATHSDPSEPWMIEPDRVEFKAHGLDCLMVRNSDLFHWCGYVGVKPGHPFFEKHYDEINVEVHGGPTYSEACGGFVCHKTEDPQDKTWWIGFDCAHSGDFSPGIGGAFMQPPERRLYGTYKDLDYVKNEVTNLAKQLAEMLPH